MKNLFDLDILRIKFEGVEVSLIKIGDGDIIYEKAPFYVPYEFRNNEFLNKVTTMVDTPHDNLSYMFYNCEKLTSVNTEDWNTCNVAIMNHMFYRCSHLVTLDVANFDTSNVTNMSYMFKDCLLLTLINGLSNWDTSKVTDMNNMFANCDSLTSLDLSNWDVSNVTYDYLRSFTEMFVNCDALKYLNLSNWHNTNRVEMRDIFAGCSSLEVLDLRNWVFTDIYSTWEAFMGCTSLRTIRLDNCSKYVISKIVDALKDGSLIPEAIPGVTKTIYCKEENAAGLTLPYPWEFNHNIDEEVIMPSLPNPKPGEYIIGQFRNSPTATEVTTIVNESHIDLSYMFSGCYNFISVNTEDWNTCNVINMSYMFHACRSLTSLDISSFDTSNVTNMSYMFYNCDSLTTLNLSGFDTLNVINIDEMFTYCYKLHTLRLNNCSYDTVNKIIASKGFPTNEVYNEDGNELIPRTIYCSKALESMGLTAPENWAIQYV